MSKKQSPPLKKKENYDTNLPKVGTNITILDTEENTLCVVTYEGVWDSSKSVRNIEGKKVEVEVGKNITVKNNNKDEPCEDFIWKRCLKCGNN